MEIILVRHGFIDYEGRVPGRLGGLHLSQRGHTQAASIAQHLCNYGVDSIISSPLERCIETALPLSKAIGVTVQISDDLAEIEFGDWSGRSFLELEGEPEWKRFHSLRSLAAVPGGELMVEVQRRMIELVERTVECNSGKKVVMVSHNDPIKSALTYFCGIPLDLFLRISIDPGSISVLQFGYSSAVLKSLNIDPLTLE